MAAALHSASGCPSLGQLSLLPCRPGFPVHHVCLCLPMPLLPPGPHLLALCRQLPDLLEGTGMQQQTGSVSAPGGASFSSDLHYRLFASAGQSAALCPYEDQAEHVPAALAGSRQRMGDLWWTWLEELAPACPPPSSWVSCLEMTGAQCTETSRGAGNEHGAG